MNPDRLYPSADAAPLRYRQHQYTGAKTSTRLSWPAIYMFTFGFGWAVAVEFQFRIYLAEVIVLALLPFLRWSALFGEYRALPRVLMCLGIWSVAIVISDLYNETSTINTLRALSTPLLASASLVFSLACIHRAPASLLASFVGMALGKIIFGEPLYGPEWAERAIDASALLELNYFKTRIEPFATPLLLVLLGWFGRKNPRRIILPTCLIGLAYILLDARSMGLVFLLATGAFYLALRGTRLSRTALAVGAAILAGVLYVLFIGYVDYTLRENMTSQTGRQLLAVENPYNPIELLRAGRSEWTVMPDAIAERPVMGWGSWAEDTRNRFSFLRAERSGVVYTSLEQFEGVTFIPAHSVIGSAWMWSGLLGFVALVWLGVVLVRLGIAAASQRTSYLFLTLFLSASLAWAYFFSPPQSVRIQFPLAMAMLIYLGSKTGTSVPRSPVETNLARTRN